MHESIRAQLINTRRDLFQETAPVAIHLRAAAARSAAL